jgi:hypothetical protein
MGKTKEDCGAARKLIINRKKRATTKTMNGRGIRIDNRAKYRAAAAERFEYKP